jgi:hypothetical protein
MRMCLWVGVGSVLWLAGCPSEPECGLAGTYAGGFVGDETGTVEITVSVSAADGIGVVEYRMTNQTLDLFGVDDGIDCSLGSFVLPLEDPAGAEVGEALGSLGTLNGSGTWSLYTGVDGTWNY